MSIIVENISKSYNDNVVLESINLEIKKGVIYGILGRNGVRGTFRLLQTTPLKKGVFIISQIIVRLIIAIVQIFFFILIGYLMGMFNLSIVIPLFAASLLGMAMILTLGFIFGSVFRSVEISSGVLGGFSAPVLMLSGVLFPLYLLPSTFELIAKFIPLTYLGDLIRSIMFPNIDPMNSIYINILMLFGSTLLFFIIARLTFKWEVEAK